MDRRLAAVLAADVAGYSRLIGKDEAGTIAALRGHLAAMAPVMAARGRHEEALARMHEAMRLNPFQPTWYNVRLAMPLFGLGRYAEAAQALRTIPTPGYWSLARLAACYGALGLASEAAATKAAILAERPDFTMADFMQRDVLLERAEDRQTLLQALRSAGLPE